MALITSGCVPGQGCDVLVYLDGYISRRREFCHFDDTPFSSVLKHLIKAEGGAAE